MSRRKRKRNKQPSATESKRSTSGPPEPATPPDPAVVAKSRRRFWIAVGLVAAWWAVLIGLARFSANPVTVNRKQIRSSRRIVTAEVIDASAGTVKVVKDWSGGPTGGTLRVQGLADSGAKDNESYILPLTEDAESNYRITTARISPGARPIYPASEAAVEQLTAILEEMKPPRRR